MGDEGAAGFVAFDHGEGAIRSPGVVQRTTDDLPAAGGKLAVTGMCF